MNTSFENNKLINPDIIEDDESEYDDDDIENSVLELDDESLEIINKFRNKDINTIFKEFTINTNKVNKVRKQKKSLSLQDFNKTYESEKKLENTKFISKRVKNKKNELKIDILEEKRHFNPRKPPYNFIRKNISNNIPEFKNIKEFPKLI